MRNTQKYKLMDLHTHWIHREFPSEYGPEALYLFRYSNTAGQNYFNMLKMSMYKPRHENLYKSHGFVYLRRDFLKKRLFVTE